jgi:gluconate 2-dehydrogenase gamma chain
MSTRRDALRILTGTTAVLPSIAVNAQEVKEASDQPGHLHTGPAIQPPSGSNPTFFQREELATVEAMSERIIPRSDTPGAKDAGVALLIDKAIVANPSLIPVYRAGIADLNALSEDNYGKLFRELTEERQIEVLTPLSLETESSLGKFFALVKSMTVDAYYKTEAGLKTELGWHGNTYVAVFEGCDHPEHKA